MGVLKFAKSIYGSVTWLETFTYAKCICILTRTLLKNISQKNSLRSRIYTIGKMRAGGGGGGGKIFPISNYVSATEYIDF